MALVCIFTLGVATSVAATPRTQTTPTALSAGHGKSQAKLLRICRRQQQLHANAFTSCEYPGAYTSALRNPKKKALLKKQKLHRPGEETFRDHRLLFWIANPAAKEKYDLLRMPPKQAFLKILREDHGFSEAEIKATIYIIETAPEPENDSWNPCRAYGEGPDINCAQSRARNGMMLACGIPMFQPCRVFGDVIAQAHAFYEYVTDPIWHGYHSVFDAAEHKRKLGWY